MSAQPPLPSSPYLLETAYTPPLLRATVTGGEDTTLPVTGEYWLRIADLVGLTGARQLLVVDHMQGEVMTDAELDRFFDLIEGRSLADVRIAYVEGRVDQTSRIEYVELLARERGYVVRMFGNETDALVWLRHGGT